MIRIGPGAKGLEGEREGFEGGGNEGARVWRRERKGGGIKSERRGHA